MGAVGPPAGTPRAPNDASSCRGQERLFQRQDRVQRVVIQLDSVSVSFGTTRPALDGLTLKVHDGELLALVGPSGSGKTTALRVMNALAQPTQGTVTVDGRPLAEWSAPELRRQMGYVIQDVGLFPHWTVERNVGCVPLLLGWPKRQVEERASELLEQVGLSREFLGRFPSQLSGGQRQRVGIARALAARPNYLLMDEPFGALDPLTRLKLRKLVQNRRATDRITTIMVTHDLETALTLADRIAILRDGKLVQLSAPRELVENPADPWAAEFLNAGRGSAVSNVEPRH